MYPRDRAQVRAGRFHMIAARLEATAKGNPNEAGMLAQATEMRRMAKIMDGIFRAAPDQTVIGSQSDTDTSK